MRAFAVSIEIETGSVMASKIIGVVVCGLLLAAGCNSNKNESGFVKSVGSKEAAELNAENSIFEKSEDPPFNLETRYAAGQLAESQGAPQRAVEQYEAALKLDPKFAPAVYRLGVVYAQLRNYPQAIEEWQKYLALTGGSANAYGNLGFCYELSGQRDKAAEAFEQGIARDSKNQLCRVNYGLMLARAGKPDDALVQLESVLTPAQAHYNLASVYEQQGQKDQARQEYAKALELNPGMWEAQKRMQALK
jgi:tetratricopeptide (TPR) repeat protein